MTSDGLSITWLPAASASTTWAGGFGKAKKLQTLAAMKRAMMSRLPPPRAPVQISLSTRQHILFSTGLRFPVNARDGTLYQLILPGFVLAGIYAAMIYLQIKLDPAGAPAYDMPKTKVSAKVRAICLNILPMGLVVFMVVGFILLGLTTPTEAAPDR